MNNLLILVVRNLVILVVGKIVRKWANRPTILDKFQAGELIISGKQTSLEKYLEKVNKNGIVYMPKGYKMEEGRLIKIDQ
ncbi:MAG: hypothetical protein NTY79_03205 [Chloroflexi bacterium]|nr:hypothetical protein [Chloroflexota bacterium]